MYIDMCLAMCIWDVPSYVYLNVYSDVYSDVYRDVIYLCDVCDKLRELRDEDHRLVVVLSQQVPF